jgi:hypothetical protein
MGVETTLQRWAAVLLLLTCVPAWAGVCRATTKALDEPVGGAS